ncbi:MAG: biopolymer transport protein [Pseudomonadota bacterium]|jgi:biopolymer transport protein ExbD
MGIRFKRSEDPAPEIILVPFIDVLLVVLIFMALSATFSRYAELQVQLPQAQGSTAQEKRPSLWLQINAQGQVFLDRQPLGRIAAQDLAEKMRPFVGSSEPPTLVIGADARTPHQSVVSAMEAARMAGLGKITFMSHSAGRQP